MSGSLIQRSTILRLFAVLVICILLFPTPAQASPDCPCFTLRDSDTHSISGVVNTYFPGTSSVSSGSTHISIGPGRGAPVDIASGDLLLVIQMQNADFNTSNTSAYGMGGTSGTGYTDAKNSGLYEFVVATSAVPFLTGGTLAVDGINAGGLANSYSNSDVTGFTRQKRFQVIHVPAYMNVRLTGTLTALPWDGKTGGVVTIDVVNEIKLNSQNIDVSGLGFRGGGGRKLNGDTGLSANAYATLSTSNANGSKGEGIAGTPKWVFSSGALVDTLPAAGSDGYLGGSYARGGPATAGGGATDGNPLNNDQNSGGGGGANGGAGGKGGNTYSSNTDRGGLGGSAFAQINSDRVVLGGGGGAGSTNDGTGSLTAGQASAGSLAAGLASSGATGGGIVIIRTGSFTGSGAIKANGSDALSPLNDGAGGGGAGGSIVVVAKNNPLTNLSIFAQGGRGGDAWPLDGGGSADRHGPGGGGGGGGVYLSGNATTIDVSGGLNGTTTTLADAYGAAPGADGKIVKTITISNMPGARPGFQCYTPTAVDLVSLKAKSLGGPLTALPYAALLLGIVLVSASFRRLRS
jgi:hypothetical protein